MGAIKTTGKIIIILAFIGSLNPYLYIFTIPAFIIGLILIWISKLNIKAKTLWTIVPVLIWYPASFPLMYLFGTIEAATGQKLDFIFPENFNGKAIIVEKMPCGQAVRFENGREQLFVPETGVLLYQGELKSGYINHKYYKMIQTGQKVELPEGSKQINFDSGKHNNDTTSLGVYILGMGNKTNSKGNSYSYMDVLVSSKERSGKSFKIHHDQALENLADSLVNHCK